MKKEINPAVAVGVVVVVLIGIVIYMWQAQGSRTLPSIPRGGIHRPGGSSGGDTQRPGASGS